MTPRNNMLKLKKLMKEEQSIADKDMKAARIMRPELLSALRELEDMMFHINKKLSDFNAPGLRTAFYNAIMAGLKVKKQAFVWGPGRKIIDNYLKR